MVQGLSLNVSPNAHLVFNHHANLVQEESETRSYRGIKDVKPAVKVQLKTTGLNLLFGFDYIFLCHMATLFSVCISEISKQ